MLRHPPPDQLFATMTASSKILFIDDDQNLLAAFQRGLRKQFSFDTATGGPDGIKMVETSGPYAVVVCDMRMPGMDGVKVLERVRELSPDTVRIMLTGNADQQTAVDAVNRGQIFRFLSKPCGPDVLLPTIDTALKQYQLLRTERELLEGTLTGSVKVLSEILGMVAPAAAERSLRLRDGIRVFARTAGIGPEWEFEIGALLSPIGFASVPPNTLRKLEMKGDLTLEEKQIVQRVPQVGHDLLKGIPRLQGVASIVLYQNKHYSGGGFPTDFISGEEIPIGARMLKILLDRLALETDGIVKQRAHATMKSREGIYDPRLLEMCFECLQEVIAGAVGSDEPMLTLSIDELAPGQIIAEDIQTIGGLLVVGHGSHLTATMVERLRNLVEIGEIKEPFFVHQGS